MSMMRLVVLGSLATGLGFGQLKIPGEKTPDGMTLTDVEIRWDADGVAATLTAAIRTPHGFKNGLALHMEIGTYGERDDKPGEPGDVICGSYDAVEPKSLSDGDRAEFRLVPDQLGAR